MPIFLSTRAQTTIATLQARIAELEATAANAAAELDLALQHNHALYADQSAARDLSDDALARIITLKNDLACAIATAVRLSLLSDRTLARALRAEATVALLTHQPTKDH